VTFAIYPSARTALLTGQINMLTDTVMLVPLDSTYTYDETDRHLNDVTTTPVATAQIVSVIDVTDGEVHVQPITFPGVADGTTITGLVAYIDAGTPAVSPLLGFTNRRGDTVTLSVPGTGGDITFTFDDYLLKI
jgi:hypothetical protein